MPRRRIRPLVAAVPLVLTLLAAAPAPALDEWPALASAPLVSGLSRPLGIVDAGDGRGRLFVLEQAGRVRIVRGNTLAPVPFLDIVDLASCCGEQGLLGLAFPPGFRDSGRFYVSYTDNAGDSVVARYRVSGDPDVADRASGEVVLTVDQPFANHNGGHIAFGPDGYLYVGLGDGGSGGDPQGNGQKRSTLLGKLLRIDVESGVVPYAVPPGNPFVGVAGTRPEIWALGLRNPWRFSFGRRSNALWIGDVGQNAWEEIDRQAAGSPGGENYGWNTMEGSRCYAAASCDTAGLTLPVAEYPHAEGCSVTGGVEAWPDGAPRLRGTYLFGDYCTGTIWGLRETSPGSWERRELLRTGMAIASFGEDAAGNVYVADLAGGTIHMLREEPAARTADLAVAAASVPPPFPTGAEAAVAVRISNAGPDAATNVRLTVLLPPGFEAGRAPTLEGGECSRFEGAVECRVEVLPPGAAAVATLAVKAASPGSAALAVAGTAGETDPSLPNNSLAIPLSVVDAPLSASVSVTPSSAEAPFPAHFSATVSGGRPPYSLLFDPGDGSPSYPAQQPSHIYNRAGRFTVTVRVADSAGGEAIATATVDALTRRLVPAATHAPGVAGTAWRTSLALVNRQGSPMTATLRFLTGGEPVEREATVPAWGTVAWDDLLVDLFGLAPEAAATGAVEVVAPAPFVASSRVYNRTAAGTYGQSMPALALSDALPAGPSAVLPHLAKGADFRTNVGGANLGTSTATLQFLLVGADGALLGEPVYLEVPPGRWAQRNDLFGAAGAGEGAPAYALVRVLDGGGPAWVCASVVDNRTGDPTTVEMVRE